MKEASVILEEINRSGGNSAACHAQMYIMGSLLRHGSEEQKRRYLPKIAKGEVTFSGKPTANHYNPLGTVHGGYAATLLDSCMGCVIHSMLEPGQGYTTLEIKINYVRALTLKVPLVLATGKILHIGRRAATSEGRLVDEAGTLYAHGTTTCMIFDL